MPFESCAFRAEGIEFSHVPFERVAKQGVLLEKIQGLRVKLAGPLDGNFETEDFVLLLFELSLDLLQAS